jgi:hypothetical protein
VAAAEEAAAVAVAVTAAAAAWYTLDPVGTLRRLIEIE